MYCSSLQQRLDAGLQLAEVEFYEQEINLEKQEVDTLHEATATLSLMWSVWCSPVVRRHWCLTCVCLSATPGSRCG